MRFKIKLGFTLISLVLLLTGITSYIELGRLTASVAVLVENGAKSISLSKAVLDVIQEQNLKVMKYYQEEEDSLQPQVHRSTYFMDTKLMDSLYLQALGSYPHSRELAAISSAKNAYIRVLSSDYMYSLDSRVFLNEYINAYTAFSNAVKDYMISSQLYVVNKTEEMKGNIYRTTMQSVVAMGVNIVILWIFFIMINTFFIRPTLGLMHPLETYIKYGRSFKITDEGVDESGKLQDLVLQLVQKVKDLQKELEK